MNGPDRQLIADLLRELVAGGDERAIARRVMEMDCLFNPSDGKQAALAKKLGLSRQAVSSAVDKINDLFEKRRTVELTSSSPDEIR